MSIDTEPSGDVAAQVSSEPVLVPVLSARWALTKTHLAIVAVFCALFVLLNHLPLRGTDLWGHIAFGERILAERSLPTFDPLQPLAEGMRIVDVQWLSQAIFAAADRLGVETLAGLFSIVVGLAYVVLARTSYLQTKSPLLATLLTAAAFLVGWSRVATIRPENFAVLLFAVVLWLMIGRRVRRDESVLADDVRGDWRVWIGLPVIGMLWANLHGSFPLLIVALGCFWLGRVMEVVWHERSLRAVLLDREARRELLWVELAFLGTLVNPYGIDASIEAVRFSSNPNLREILEWSPMYLFGPGGREFAAACIVMAFVWRHSRRAVAPADVLLLGFFGLAAVMQIRMVGWFAFVWCIAAAPHLADIVGRVARRRPIAVAEAESLNEEPAAPTYRYTVACLGLIWIAFAFTTLSRPLLGGNPRNEAALYGESTPLAVSKWLDERRFTGQTFNPQHWGDWFARTVPDMQLFATTNVHLLPHHVWNDYQRIARGDFGFDATLDRYAVRTVVVDRTAQPVLARVLPASPDWTKVYEDDQALVFRRVKSSSKAASTPAAKH